MCARSHRHVRILIVLLALLGSAAHAFANDPTAGGEADRAALRRAVADH